MSVSPSAGPKLGVLGDLSAYIEAERQDLENGITSYSVPAVDETWPQLEPPALPVFPLEALPADVRLFAESVAEEAQTPVDLPAIGALTVLSAAALGIRVDVHGGWSEELALYLLVAMPSGERKSTVMRHVLEPLQAIERDRRIAERATIRAAKTDRERARKRKDRILNDLSKPDADGAELGAELEELENCLDGSEPEAYRLLAQDFTPEALVGLMAKHGRIAAIAAEGSFLVNALGRYSDGNANLDALCLAYAGETIRVDRRGRETEIVERPLLTIGLTVQEHIMRALLENDIARMQGLVSRFAFASPESFIGRRRTLSDAVPPQLADRWTAIVKRVHALVPLTETTETADQGGFVSSVSNQELAVETLSLSPSAKKLLDAERSQLEPRQAAGGDLANMRDWISRHPGRVARMSGGREHFSPRLPQNPGVTVSHHRALLIGRQYVGTHRQWVNMLGCRSRSPVHHRLNCL